MWVEVQPEATAKLALVCWHKSFLEMVAASGSECIVCEVRWDVSFI